MHQRRGREGLVAASLVAVGDFHAAQGTHDVRVATGRCAQTSAALVPCAIPGHPDCLGWQTDNLDGAGDKPQDHTRAWGRRWNVLGRHARESVTAWCLRAPKDVSRRLPYGLWLGRDVRLARDGNRVVHGDKEQARPFDLVCGQTLGKLETYAEVRAILGFQFDVDGVAYRHAVQLDRRLDGDFGGATGWQLEPRQGRAHRHPWVLLAFHGFHHVGIAVGVVTVECTHLRPRHDLEPRAIHRATHGHGLADANELVELVHECVFHRAVAWWLGGLSKDFTRSTMPRNTGRWCSIWGTLSVSISANA